MVGGQPTRWRLAKFGLATFVESTTPEQAVAYAISPGDRPMLLTQRGRDVLATAKRGDR